MRGFDGDDRNPVLTGMLVSYERRCVSCVPYYGMCVCSSKCQPPCAAEGCGHNRFIKDPQVHNVAVKAIGNAAFDPTALTG